MTHLHTNEDFLTKLRDASTENPDRQQRVSFIMGSLPDENSMTREQVESVLDRDIGQGIGSAIQPDWLTESI